MLLSYLDTISCSKRYFRCCCGSMYVFTSNSDFSPPRLHSYRYKNLAWFYSEFVPTRGQTRKNTQKAEVKRKKFIHSEEGELIQLHKVVVVAVVSKEGSHSWHISEDCWRDAELVPVSSNTNLYFLKEESYFVRLRACQEAFKSVSFDLEAFERRLVKVRTVFCTVCTHR